MILLLATVLNSTFLSTGDVTCYSPEKKLKSVENHRNQLLKSGDFLSGENQQNQETPGQIRRFGMPDLDIINMYKKQLDAI